MVILNEVLQTVPWRGSALANQIPCAMLNEVQIAGVSNRPNLVEASKLSKNIKDYCNNDSICHMLVCFVIVRTFNIQKPSEKLKNRGQPDPLQETSETMALFSVFVFNHVHVPGKLGLCTSLMVYGQAIQRVVIKTRCLR